MAADALKTPGAAVLLAFIGDVLQDKGDLQGALKMYQRSQHIREATQTVDSIWGAHQLSQTGSLHLDLGDVETAAPLIEQAEQILLHLGLAQTPEPWGTQTRMIVGLLRTAQGRHEAAVTAFEQAKEVATACGNLESRGGALILTGYGVALAAAGDRPMAEAQLREAKRIRENCGILDTGGASGGHALCQLLQTLERGESLAGTGGDGKVTAGVYDEGQQRVYGMEVERNTSGTEVLYLNQQDLVYKTNSYTPICEYGPIPDHKKFTPFGVPVTVRFHGARAVSTSAVESVTDSDHSDGAAAARAEAAATAATVLAAGVVRLAVDAEVARFAGEGRLEAAATRTAKAVVAVAAAEVRSAQAVQTTRPIAEAGAKAAGVVAVDRLPSMIR